MTEHAGTGPCCHASDTASPVASDVGVQPFTELAREAQAGLLARPAALPPKFFYDALGSRLFDAITALDEYYPTRTEAAIFERHRDAIAQAVHHACGDHPVMIDLGAGDAVKAEAWFAALTPRRYVAVDISVEHLERALARLRHDWPSLDMVGVGCDFSQRLELAGDLVGEAPALVFYPGSSIGNFDPEAAVRLLGEMRAVAQGGALLIGVDRVKDVDVLEAAYDDPLGVTAAFNLNLLRHVNRVLGSDFDPVRWRHVAFYDPVAARIEMHLESRIAQTARWPGGQRRFEAGERLHTENSHKWTPEAFTALLQQAGWTDVRHWSDERGWFSVFLAHA